MYQPANPYSPAFFNQQPKKHGSSLKPYKPERIREENHYGFCKLNSILGMIDYKGTSIDEIRNEDYELNRKPTFTFYNVNLNNLPPLQNQQSRINNWSAPNTQAPSFMQNTTNTWDNANKANDMFKPTSTIGQSGFGSAAPTTTPWSTFGSNTAQTTSNPWTAPATENKTTNWNTQANTTAQPSMFAPTSAYVPPTQTSYQPPSQPNQPTNTTQPLFTQPSTTFNFQMPKQPETFQQQNQSYVPPSTFNYSTQQSFQDTTNIDPYSVSTLKFETSTVQEIPLKKLLTKDLFEEVKEEKELKLEIIKESKNDKQKRLMQTKKKIYTIPSIEEIKNMSVVKNLRICIENKAYIDYLKDVKGSDVILEDKVELAKPIIYMADEKGVGLNKRARVTFNEFWPFFRGKLIKTEMTQYPEKGVIDRFVYELKNNEVLQFVSYDIETGSYVYEVEGFESA